MTEPTSPMINSVLGPLHPDDLGSVMMHEHIGPRRDPGLSPYYKEPSDPFRKRMAHEPVTVENLWWVRYNLRDNIDNNTPAPDEDWQRDMDMFAASGGGTLVEVTPGGFRGLARVAAMARETGVNVITATGWYVDGSYDPDLDMPSRTVDELAAIMVSEIEDGDPETGIRAGIIGELGCSWPLTTNERKVLQAGAVAQQQTGLPITIHPGRNEEAPGEIRDVLRDAGADLSRVVMGHVDRCGYEPATLHSLLDDGMTIEYDVFGTEGYYPAEAALADGTMPEMPNDTGRIKQIKDLLAGGYGDRLVVGHDVHMKVHLTRYGGWGYGHFLRNVVPLMRIWGVEESDIVALTTANPRRLLTPARV